MPLTESLNLRGFKLRLNLIELRKQFEQRTEENETINTVLAGSAHNVPQFSTQLFARFSIYIHDGGSLMKQKTEDESGYILATAKTRI